MSMWYKIKDQEDVEISEDGKTIDVLFGGDHNGNNYVEIPIEFITNVLTQPPVKADAKCTCDGEIGNNDIYCPVHGQPCHNLDV